MSSSSSLHTLHAKYYHDKHVLVTGGAGFIGSHLVDQLCSLGAHVTVLDNLSTGRIDNLFKSATQVTFLKSDITNKAMVEKATTGITHLFHFAGITTATDPRQFKAINERGTLLLYEAAGRSNVHSVVFASSASVYGSSNTPCVESQPLSPATPYAHSKAACEQLGQSLAAQTHCTVANLRLFNVHGPRQRTGVVATLTNSLKKGAPLTLHGDGTQTRDFIPVNDVVTASLQAGLCTPLRGQALNVATGTSITVRQLITQLEDDLGTTAVEIDEHPARTHDTMHSAASVQRLHRLLAYRP